MSTTVTDLRQSRFKVFDVEYAEWLQRKHPRIWAAGGNTKGNSQFALLVPVARNDGAPRNTRELIAVQDRERWGPRHFANFRLPGVIALMKWLVVGGIGERLMKDVAEDAIRKAAR